MPDKAEWILVEPKPPYGAEGCIFGSHSLFLKIGGLFYLENPL
jgi:hypothetical protein